MVMTPLQLRTIGRLRKHGKEVIVRAVEVNTVTALVIDPDQPDIIRKVGLNSNGRITMDVVYREEAAIGRSAPHTRRKRQGAVPLSTPLKAQASFVA